ncbi:MAG: GNAT family N-acetyltransferase [Gemmobacter sp.]
MTALRVVAGLPDALRPDAARLYWQAFGTKLGRVLGPEGRALAYLERAISRDHVIVALSDGDALLGLIGFRSADGGFAEGTLADLRRVYGRFGALWRAAAMRAISREVDNDRFLIDGICVAAHARGQGVGTALIEALARDARARPYAELRLDVIDTNLRARALYERLGFRAVRTEQIGPLRLLFGFQRAITMVRPLG